MGADRIGRAHVLLSHELKHIRFSRILQTEPIGLQSPPFYNGLATATTLLSRRALRKKLKRAERRCGDTRAKRRRNIITMDIDLLGYGDERMKAADWERYYIKQLLEEINTPTK